LGPWPWKLDATDVAVAAAVMTWTAPALPYGGVESEEDLLWEVQSGTHHLVLLRGPAGCGRSTFAMAWMSKQLDMSVDSLRESGGLVKMHICSPADFEEHCCDDSDATELNEERVEIAMRLGITPIVVDDAHMRLSEMTQYVDLARAFQYKVIVVHPVAFNREWNCPSSCMQQDEFPDETCIRSPDGFEAFVGFFDDDADSTCVIPPDSRPPSFALSVSESPDRKVKKNFAGWFSVVARRRGRDEVDLHHNTESDQKDKELWGMLVSRAVDRSGAPEDIVEQLQPSGMPGQSLTAPAAGRVTDQTPARIPRRSCREALCARVVSRRPPATKYTSLRDLHPRTASGNIRTERAAIFRRAFHRLMRWRARSPDPSCLSDDESDAPSGGKSRSMAQLLICFSGFCVRCPGAICSKWRKNKTWATAKSKRELGRHKVAWQRSESNSSIVASPPDSNMRVQHRQISVPEQYSLSPPQSEDEDCELVL